MSEITIKHSIFPEEKDKFSWDENALRDFKDLIKEEGVKCRMDDMFLLGFLRSRKFDLRRSLEQLKNYYEVRVSYPQYFKNLVPSKLEHALNANINQFLPKPDQDGNYVFIFNCSNWDTSVVNSNDIMRVMQLVMDFQLNFHRTQVNKIVCIIDSAGLSLSHFIYLTPRFIATIATLILKDNYPIRYHALHYVNLNIVMKAFLSILIPLMPAKLKPRLHFHTDMKSLHEFVKPDYLPEELGGNLPSNQKDEFIKTIKANEELFRKNEEYVKKYEEDKNKNFSVGKFRYFDDFEDEKVEKFIKTSEEKFKCYSEDPEKFLEALQQDSEFETTHF